MRASAANAGIALESARAAVVGATGNVGSVLAELLAEEVSSLVLVGRPARRKRLEAFAERIMRSIVRDVPGSPIGRMLIERGPTLGPGCPLEVAVDLGACRDCDLVVAASNDPRGILRPVHLSEARLIVNDLSVPSDVHPTVFTERPRATVIRGGIVRTPANPEWRVPGVPLEAGEMYACMTETVLMGLEGATEHGSYGPLTTARVRQTVRMAERHGFASIRAARTASY